MAPFGTTSTQKPFHIGFNTGYFPPLGLSTTKDQFCTHPTSHPWVCIAQCQEGWVPGLYSSCKIAKALSIIIRTHPSNSYNVIHPALELRAIKNKQTSNYPGTSVLRCRGSLIMVMYKLYNKPARKVLA